LTKVVRRLCCAGAGVVGCVTVDVGSGPVPAAAPPVASCGRLGRAGVSRGEALATASLRTCCFKSSHVRARGSLVVETILLICRYILNNPRPLAQFPCVKMPSNKHASIYEK
jgi:hypothetical protein